MHTIVGMYRNQTSIHTFKDARSPKHAHLHILAAVLQHELGPAPAIRRRRRRRRLNLCRVESLAARLIYARSVGRKACICAGAGDAGRGRAIASALARLCATKRASAFAGACKGHHAHDQHALSTATVRDRSCVRAQGLSEGGDAVEGERVAGQGQAGQRRASPPQVLREQRAVGRAEVVGGQVQLQGRSGGPDHGLVCVCVRVGGWARARAMAVNWTSQKLARRQAVKSDARLRSEPDTAQRRSSCGTRAAQVTIPQQDVYVWCGRVDEWVRKCVFI